MQQLAPSQWPWTPGKMFGLVPTPADTTVDRGAPPGIARSAGPGVASHTPAPWSPESPLFWFGALLAVTVGLMAVSVQGRVGNARAGVNLGKA